MDENENLMESSDNIMCGCTNTNIYKSAVITVDLAKYQNIKLYSSFSAGSDGLTKDEEREFNKKIWVDRGEDLKYALKSCLRKLAKMEKPSVPDVPVSQTENSFSATIRKSCEITVEILKTQNQYQSAKFSSGKEWSISYTSEDERKTIEREKWDEIAEDLECSMKLFFDSLGKKTDAPDKFSELCKQRIEAKKPEAKVDVENKNEITNANAV